MWVLGIAALFAGGFAMAAYIMRKHDKRYAMTFPVSNPAQPAPHDPDLPKNVVPFDRGETRDNG